MGFKSREVKDQTNQYFVWLITFDTEKIESEMYQRELS